AAKAVLVQPGTHTVHRGEQLFAVRIVHHTDDGSIDLEGLIALNIGSFVRHQRDRHGVVRNAMQEIGSAIKWVDVPCGGSTCLAPGFLCHDTKLWRVFLELLDNGGFRVAVSLGYEVVPSLFVDDKI